MKIRNPEAYQAAEQRRQDAFDKLAAIISRRIVEVIRHPDKYGGTLSAATIDIACMMLAMKENGALKSHEGRPSPKNKHQNQRQMLVRAALELAIGQGYVNLQDDGDGIVLTVPKSEPANVETEGLDEHYMCLAEDYARSRKQAFALGLA